MEVSDDLKKLRREAERRVVESEGAEPEVRKCWNCDPGKGFLKDRPQVIRCWSCLNVYYLGTDLELGKEEENE